MDSRKTIEGDAGEQPTGNVIRLRDWLGPREELVPIGPRAAAEAPDDDPTEAQPPTAASFWDEDGGSLQAPMQAPAEAWSGGRERATDRRSAGPSAPSPRRRATPRPRIRWSLGDRLVPRRRAGAAIGGLAVCVLLALAVIGQTEGGPRTARETGASLAGASPIVTPTGVNRARLTPHASVVTQIKRHHTSRARAHHRAARQHHIQVATIRHRVVRTRAAARPTHIASAPTQSTTPTATPPTPAPVSAPPLTTTTPTPSTSSPTSPPASTGSPTASTTHHQPAFGPSGSLGPGSSPDS